jgi:Zn finger protein HypA/HybF involved in hydrogenase expression
MHELSVVANLLKILEKIKKERKSLTSFLSVNITVNPYSCSDEENLNFIFKSMAAGRKEYEGAKININRGKDPAGREFILDDVEVEEDGEEG